MGRSRSRRGHLITSDNLATIRAVATEFATVAVSVNTMARHVVDDLTGLPDAADTGAEELRVVLPRFSWDDGIEFFDLVTKVATSGGRPETGAACVEPPVTDARSDAAYHAPLG